MLIATVKSVVIWAFRRIKIPIIILNEFFDFIKVIQIKMFALDAEMPLTDSTESCALLTFVFVILLSWRNVG